MTTYHLEHRAPLEGELYLPASLVASGSAITHVAHDDFEPTSYVFTPDRPHGEHPEALLIRVNGELYGRTYVSLSNEAVYTSVNDCTNFQYAADIDEWEDIYDEVPEPEPEPEPAPWPDKPVIVIEAGKQPGRPVAVLPVVAIRMVGAPFAGAYRDEAGFFWDSDEDTITAWSEYVPDGYARVTVGELTATAVTTSRLVAPRREYTADELDNLPEGALAFDDGGGVWQRGAAHWFVAGASGAFANPLRERFLQHLYSAPPEEN